jgi:hypothetical protein
MALREQPYLPLFIQDFLTDEKLCECSAESTGVYIRLMCLMHKSKEYGTFLLWQNDWQNSGKQSSKTSGTINDFAKSLAKRMPYDVETINRSLEELLHFDVIQMENNKLLQKRMIKDNQISLTRSVAGTAGGFAKAKGLAKGVAKGLAKVVANSESEYEYENEDVNKDIITNDNDIELKKKVIIPYDDIVEFYNTRRRNMPEVKLLSDERKKTIKARFNNYGIDKIYEVITKASESDFMNGENKDGWIATGIDWIMNSSNFIKISEGSYDNKITKKPQSTYNVLETEYRKEVENEQGRNNQITGSH